MLACFGIPLAAQDSDVPEEGIPVAVYSLGDQMFSINAGLFIPLFFQAKTGEISSTNLSLGGYGSLAWGAFVGNQFSLGAEFGGAFSMSPLGRVLIHIPITFNLSYFFRLYPFDIPIHLGAGVVFTKLQDELFVGPLLKPGFSFYWNITTEWAIGLRVNYWWVPQIYLQEDLKDHSRFGNFLETSLSGLYHF